MIYVVAWVIRTVRLVRDSNLSQFLILKKCQTVEQYWNWGKMKALYNFTLVAVQIIKVTKSWHYSVSIVDFFTY